MDQQCHRLVQSVAKRGGVLRKIPIDSQILLANADCLSVPTCNAVQWTRQTWICPVCRVRHSAGHQLKASERVDFMAMSSPIHLLIVDDDDLLRESMVQRFRRLGMVVTEAASGEDALTKAAEVRCDVALLDLHLPGMSGIELLQQLKTHQPELEALMLTAHGSMETAVLAMKQGAYDYLTKPFQLADLEVHIQKACEKARLARRERQWVEQLTFESSRYRLVGSSPSLMRVVQIIQKVAPTEATVLVRGASGTGKELVARALHLNSPRRDRPLVTINCAALQETLLESELFGHEKGAFTGATQAKRGLVEVAEGGTLFVDEIAEMAPDFRPNSFVSWKMATSGASAAPWNAMRTLAL